MHRSTFFVMLTALVLGGLIDVPSLRGRDHDGQFSFDEYLLAPVRVHLLSARAWPALQTTLAEKDITRILGKVNGIWAQAGIHFYLKSLVREEAVTPENNVPGGGVRTRFTMLDLRPAQSRDTNLLHLYYVKEMSMNGICFPEAIFVKDTATLNAVPGGIDEPIPRVTSHELGHAFSLSHRQDNTNLMASGTTGTGLNEVEIGQAREAALKLDWIESANELMKRADALFRANQEQTAADLYSRLATIPVKAEQVESARKRATPSTRTNPGSATE